MPYVSRAQQGFAHSPAGKAKGFPTAEFDAASKGQHGLPQHVAKKGKKKPSRKKRPTRFPMPMGSTGKGGY